MKVHGSWTGTIALNRGVSILADTRQRAPLKVAKPFTGEHGELLLYLMDASPGLFNGDRQEIECRLLNNTHLYLTNQSSCKLHPSLAAFESRQIQRFYLHEGAVLEYFPEPLVPYRGADFIGETVVEMRTGAQAIIGEILTPGRVGRGEVFQYKKVVSRFSVYWNGKWTVWDSLVLEPGNWLDAKQIFGDFTHFGTLWVLSEKISNRHVEQLQELISFGRDDPVYAGVSLLLNNGLAIRMLGGSASALQSFMHACWDRVRRELLGKPSFKVRK
ncbi:urease accessory protein UreD [Effusibacillus pohliae]|uniref:urease accessory protein UreD n=1 Tax=Effusibacillus pohliae TaxID=232270 RepID=UPI000373FD28|nr:urease accessory protein UreD [Effusibacillus pohliae]